MGRSPCCSKEGLNRGAWTALEDKILTDYIKIHGEGGWRNLPKKAGLERCGKSCRLRWVNYLRPDIKRGNISHDEEELIIRLHRLLGNRWSLIAGRLPGRTDNEIKNYWNTNLGKKVQGHQNPITSTRKHPNQSKEKTKPPVKQFTEAKMEPSVVVRTKALRCTEVSLTPKPKPQRVNSDAAVGPSMVVNNKSVEAESCDGLLSFIPEEDDSSDFMMDLKMGELCLSSLLHTDFSQLCDFDNPILGNDKSQPLLFPEEMLEDWTSSDSVHPDMASDLPSLAYFLDSEKEWIGE